MAEPTITKDKFIIDHVDFGLREQANYPNGGTSKFYDNGTDMVIIDEDICDCNKGEAVFSYMLITDKQNNYMHQFNRVFRFLGYSQEEVDRYLLNKEISATVDYTVSIGDRGEQADVSPLEFRFEQNFSNVYGMNALKYLSREYGICDEAVPTYVTDALVRKVNIDRYDDREIIKTNLIESYSQLLDFGRKNLPDKFFLEDTVNKSLRNTIVREMISNTLMHREFTSSYTAKFVIEKDRMYVENANRATKEGFITVDNLEPNPKNPLIASFFRNIGYADQLGSGVRKLFKYSKYYSGKDPLFVEDDVFRIIVPLDDAYSFDYGIEAGSSKVIESNNADKMPINADKMPINAGKTLVNSLSAQQNSIIQFAKETGSIKSRQVEELLGVKQRRARRILGELVNMGILERQGAYKSTVYVLKN